MSRLASKPLKIEEGVSVSAEAGKINISGPKGELSMQIPNLITVKVEDGSVLVDRKKDSKHAKALHGTARSLIKNMIQGVSSEWSKTLELVGTGYRARLEGETLVLSVGFSHPVKIDPLPGIKFAVEENKITVSGIDRHLVGQVAANIRAVRPPEPYKGKGIKYVDEVVRRKPGKQAAKAAG